MTDRDTARQQIAELVEKYRHLTEAQKRSYSEEDVKKDFLLPLFEALGWDTANTQRRNEVRAEEKIADGYPDYSFRLNGVPVFYLEAKKFSVNIGDDKPMKQAINYSYLKGVTWAVLSDFEGLMVFNADWEERDPIKARMLDLHWQNYADSDFELLWLLSRESIEAGEIDQKAEQFGRKKKRDDVNKVLFADLTLWRRELFKEITQMGTTLWSRDYRMVDEAIQRFLDRLIFIRTVEDRRIEENRLRAALRQYTSSKNKNKNLFAELLKLFRELDGIYNARLFAQHRLDTDLEIHDVNLLTTIINGLYDVKGGFANYDFAAIDADVLGAVYEQYLSFKAQDPQGQDALDLSKRSKRKAQGIYYTPKYVVRYIVQQTLGKLLDAPDMSPERAHALRILDPACGSGSFLIEAFQVLDRWLAQHGDDTDRADRRKRRMRILQENLYGVDLDPQAVEVAQLNLLLQAAHEREKLMLLPHIQQGNSLISDPAVAGSDAFDWEERFPEVMAAGGFDVVIGNPPYVRQESLGALFKDYAAHQYKTYAGTADLYVYFVEKAIDLLKPGGQFGYIIPNKWMRANYGKPLRQWLKQQAIEQIIDFGDLPVFEEATTYPCIMTIQKHERLQGSDSGLKPTVPPTPAVFTAAQVATLDFGSLEDYVSKYRYAVNRDSLDDAGWALVDERTQSLLGRIVQSKLSMDKYLDGEIYRGLLTGLDKAFVIDEQLKNDLISADVKNAELIKPYIVGRDVQRYSNLLSQRYIILVPSGWTEKAKQPDMDAWSWFQSQYHSVADYLSQFADAAQKRYDKGQYWWELRPCDYYQLFEEPKIVYLKFQVKPAFTFDEAGFYPNSAIWIIPKNDKYLLGILNSKLGWFLISKFCTEIQNGYQLIWQYLRNIPIRTINFDDPADKKRHDDMVAMVERMLKLKADHAQAEAEFSDRRHDLAHQIERLDKQIDALVYELYGLTADEIAIVEGSAG